MDQNRQIRFLIPPFFLFASLLWGIYWSDPDHSMWGNLISLDLTVYIAIVAATTLPLGYLIGTITVLLQKLFWLLFPYNYESIASIDTLDKMSKTIKSDFDKADYPNKGIFEQKRIGLNTGVLFTQEYVNNKSQNTLEWLARRWNAVNIAFNSITALALAMFLGLFFQIPMNPIWIYTTCILVIMFFTVAVLAWRDIIKMVEFLSELADKDDN